VLDNTAQAASGGYSTINIYLRYSKLRIDQKTPDYEYSFQQDTYDSAQLTVYGNNGAAIYSVSGGNFAALLREHPGEVIRYMGPLFRTFNTKRLFGADTKLAKTVLTPHRPGPEVDFLVGKIVRQLDSDSFAEREAGAASVRQIGTEALAVLQKMDRESLSPQQQTAIDAIAKEMGVTPDEAERLRRNTNFVLDCFYCDDAAVRAAAREQFTKLHASTEVKFDPNADPLPQAEIVESLRKTLAAAGATTRPQ